MKIYHSLLILVVLSSGCRISKANKEQPAEDVPRAPDSSEDDTPIVMPQRQPGLSTTPLSLSLTDTGALNERLTVRLDYFPAPKSDGLSVPTCYKQLTPNLPLGILSCVGDDSTKTEVQVQHVYQVCYTESTKPRQEPSQSAILKSCASKKAQFASFNYVPTMKVDTY